MADLEPCEPADREPWNWGDSFLAYYMIGELANKVAFARARCLDTESLIRRACDVADPDHYTMIKALRERTLTLVDQALLEGLLLRAVSDDVRAFHPPRLRAATDRLASNLGDLLSADRARFLAADLVCHRLRARRLAATKLLRRLGVTQGEAPALRDSVVTYGDPDAVELLARIPNTFIREDCCNYPNESKLAQRDLIFFKALIIANLWDSGDLDHEHAATRHTLSYVRAMGRVGSTTEIDRLIEIIKESIDPEVISMCASVAGRLRSRSAIDALELRLQDLAPSDDQFPPPSGS